VQVPQPEVSFALVSTSNLDTGASKFTTTVEDLAVGEAVVLIAKISFPEGTSDGVSVEATLPNSGLSGRLKATSISVTSMGARLVSTMVSQGQTGVELDTDGDSYIDSSTFSFG
jgi:hypothetical protein